MGEDPWELFTLTGSTPGQGSDKHGYIHDRRVFYACKHLPGISAAIHLASRYQGATKKRNHFETEEPPSRPPSQIIMKLPSKTFI
eukprot:2311461-Amphidinium_carterae.2